MVQGIPHTPSSHPITHPSSSKAPHVKQIA
jgi:hypothetical protein